MTPKELLELQSKRGTHISVGGDTSTRSIEAVVSDCRKAIREQSDKYRNADPEVKKEIIKKIIVDYVMNAKPLVQGYIDGENRPDTLKLIDKLVSDITDYGILSKAMDDETVYEIRCNEKEIKVERQGFVSDLIDESGRIVSFSSPEEQEIVMRKLLGDTKLTPKDKLVNARTLEGYRIAAVHSSAMAADPANPGADRYHSFVLRKFRKERMTLADIVKKDTLSDNMARLLVLCTAGELTFFTVGPTASGKTTTNNAILKSVPPDTRTILAQNPSEIDLRMKDESGRVYNDVLHLEAEDKENPTPRDATMENVMDHILRLSPSFVCFGEIRTNKEFAQAVKIMQAGHPANTTYHANDAEGAVSRFVDAYIAAEGNVPANLALNTLVSFVDLIIVQKIMRDGKRRILQISEVIGVNEQNNTKPKINDLYRYVIDKEPELDEAGHVKSINGTHKRVGTLSEAAITKFKEAGVPQSRYDFLIKPVDKTEVETYTGQNIDTYGLDKYRGK